jgi:hypothetical protein
MAEATSCWDMIRIQLMFQARMANLCLSCHFTPLYQKRQLSLRFSCNTQRWNATNRFLAVACGSDRKKNSGVMAIASSRAF